MISLGVGQVIILVQILVTLFILSVFLLFLLKQKNKQISVIKNAATDMKSDTAISTVEYYFNAERKLVESRFNSRFSDDDLKREEFGEADWLNLRKGLLEIEKELLTSVDSVENYWVDVADKFKKILNDGHLVKRLRMKEENEDDEEEQKEMKKLLKSQYDDFDSLLLALEGEKSEEEVKQLKEKLTTIIRSHTELSHCIHMLEEENIFLRDQIKGLL